MSGQLVAHGQTDRAEEVFLKIYPTSTHEQRQAKMTAIEMSIHEATSSMAGESLWSTFRRIFTTPATARAVAVACITMAISQLGGFNTLMYYSAKLFAIVGFSNATAVAITVSATNFIFSIVNLALVDKFGRRILMIIGLLGMTITLSIAAVSFQFIPIDLKTLEVQSDTVGWPGTLVLVCIILYVGFYSSGVATIAWIGKHTT